LNDVVKVRIKTAEPVTYDSYEQLSSNGTAILIDQTSNMTAGALLLQ
jgi:sulfate adenylyltransferase subunit 1